MTSPRLRSRLDAAAVRVRASKWFQRAATAQQGKPAFTKAQSYYVETSKTAAACSNCPWFQLGQNACLIVNPQGPPGISGINPLGICGLYDATPLRIRLYTRAYGRGTGQRGVLPQVVRCKVERTRWGLDGAGAPTCPG